MFKTRKVDEFGGQTGNEENTEDVTVTEEKIIGDDGVERTVIRKTTTKKTVQSQQITQGARVTTVKRTVVSPDGKVLSQEEFNNLSIQDKNQNPLKSIEAKKKSKESSSSSSSSDEEGFSDKIKSFFKGAKPKDKQTKAQSAIKDSQAKDKEKIDVKQNKQKDQVHNDDDNQFAEECLKWHNYYRAKHGAKPLKLSEKLNKFAKEWANNIASRDVLEHRSSNVYGENIFMKWSSDPNFQISGKDPVDNWYNEIKDHVFGVEPTSLKSGHFTQVIWKESEELGVGKAKSKSGKIIVVANYDPPGNVIGQFAKNVPVQLGK